MDFFGYQEQARRNTTRLVLLFAAAIVLIVLAVYVAVTVGLFFGQGFVQGQRPLFTVDHFWHWQRFYWVTGITLLVIFGGSAWRTWQLSEGGGAAVATMLGGERLPAATRDPLYRRLLNVVEEMAIASGMPVPPVYLLPQNGINAFAAGFTPSDAVIGVTRGAVEMLNRDELQGVIAHEFSHVFNGDTRLKMRMMGLLFGITLISDFGIMLLTARHSTRYSSRQRSSHPALMVIGILLFAVGTIGAVFADMIKRAVSRQREFLADAAAVQFTRNPAGIAGALKVIGGYKAGSRVAHAGATQASHFFFSNALKSWYAKDWWATHPPLVDRIRRIEPGFRGQPAHIDATQRSMAVAAEAAIGFAAHVVPLNRRFSASDMIDAIGNPEAAHLRQADNLLARMPDRLREFAHDPYTARAAVYAMLLADDAKQRKQQLNLLSQSADPNVFRETLEIQPMMQGLSPELRLPLVDMMVPALKELSEQQYKMFVKNVGVLIKSDHQVSLFEYTLHRVLLGYLHATFAQAEPPAVKFHKASQLRDECACILAQLVRYGTHADREAVYNKAIETLLGETHPMPSEKDCRLSHFDKALRRLKLAAPRVKKQLLTAAVECVLADGQLTIHEVEAMRAVADALDCPMPPLLG
jgi:Zn-dependent protease with chaperone function/uncharacterized tellurite resistance protein B-like protein